MTAEHAGAGGKLRAWLDELRAWLDEQGFELPLLLTLLALLLSPVGAWDVRSAVLLLAAAALLHSGLRRSPWTWLALTGLTGWRVVADWPMSDNHAYLLAYWCLAIGLALLVREPERSLATSARLLIGLAFGFAVLWKSVVSPDYLDGRFFRVLFLVDERFEALALNLGGMTEASLAEARGLIEENRHVLDKRPPGELETPTLRALAAGATWGSLVLEAAVAVLFLLPRRLRISKLGDAALLIFCAGTYALAPVAGFGWLLLSMGVAQCEPERRTTRWLYLGVFALVILHDNVPWLDLVPSL